MAAAAATKGIQAAAKNIAQTAVADALKDAPLLWKATLKKSAIHSPMQIKDALRCLKLTRMHKSVYLKNIRPIRGQLNKVKHHIALEPYHFDPSKGTL